MDVTKVNIADSLSNERFLRESPMKTDKVMFNVFTFNPWQALGMHKHPGNDEVFYIVNGRCIFYLEGEKQPVDENSAIYVPANSCHGILSCERCATIISVQGPPPVTSIYGKMLEYFCPRCELETPVTVGTRNGDIVECPRCDTKLRLIESGETFEGEIIDEQTAERIRAQ